MISTSIEIYPSVRTAADMQLLQKAKLVSLSSRHSVVLEIYNSEYRSLEKFTYRQGKVLDYELKKYYQVSTDN